MCRGNLLKSRIKRLHELQCGHLRVRSGLNLVHRVYHGKILGRRRDLLPPHVRGGHLPDFLHRVLELPSGSILVVVWRERLHELHRGSVLCVFGVDGVCSLLGGPIPGQRGGECVHLVLS